MTQIRQKDYAARFRASGKTLIGIGLNFNSRTQAVDEVLVEGV